MKHIQKYTESKSISDITVDYNMTLLVICDISISYQKFKHYL